MIATSTVAFNVLKWAGVAYLVWLGVRQWRAPVDAAATTSADAAVRPQAKPRRRIVFEAFLLNAVNPKGTAFMLAVVPQFVAADRPLVPQYLAIAATLTFTDLVVNAGYAALASRLLGVLKTPRRLRLVNRVFGAIFVALGAALATFRRS